MAMFYRLQQFLLQLAAASTGGLFDIFNLSITDGGTSIVIT